MPLFNRLVVMLIVTALAGACARAPVADLTDVRSIVEHTYASGAARYAPGEYQLANSALQAAEEQIKAGDYRQAERTLELARRYASEALNITVAQKQQLAAERRRQAEAKRQAELKKQQAEAARKRLEMLEEQRRERARRLAEEEQARSAARQREQEAAQAPPEPEPEPQPLRQVKVVTGEDLAAIAARPDVYGDALLWPLIYKSNRDQIKDPREIYAGQVLIIPRDKSPAEQDAARREARELNIF